MFSSPNIIGICCFVSAISAVSSGIIFAQDDADEFRALELPKVPLSGRTLLEAVNEFVVENGISMSQTEMQFSTGESQKLFVVTIRANGYLDDSLQGEEFRIVVLQESGRFIVDRAGILYICARGENAGLAQKAFCP